MRRTFCLLAVGFVVGMAWGWLEQSALARKMLAEHPPTSFAEHDPLADLERR